MALRVPIGEGRVLGEEQPLSFQQYDYPGQDYGGPVQFALTFGVSMSFYRQFGIGYRFMHYSDGGHGRHTIGADFHLLELV